MVYGRTNVDGKQGVNHYR